MTRDATRSKAMCEISIGLDCEQSLHRKISRESRCFHTRFTISGVVNGPLKNEKSRQILPKSRNLASLRFCVCRSHICFSIKSINFSVSVWDFKMPVSASLGARIYHSPPLISFLVLTNMDFLCRENLLLFTLQRNDFVSARNSIWNSPRGLTRISILLTGRSEGFFWTTFWV